MNTKKLFSSLVRTGTRLMILASMLMTAFIGSVTPAFALPRVFSVSVGSQTGTLTAGTAGSVTYTVSVTKATTNALLANLTVTGLAGFAQCATAGSPGPCWIFSPALLLWGSGTGSQNSTLTIKTSNATAAGSLNFTVNAIRTTSPGDNASTTGTLTINSILLTPTITFGAAPTPTFPGGNFTVSATTNSNGALTYSVVSGPCAFVSGATFSSSGTGTCIVQASTAATSTYAAGSAQQSITISAGSGSSFDLYAVTGTTTLPGLANPVTVWGYNITNAPVTQPGGPILIVNQGDTVTVTLHNQLAESTALLFQGQSMIPDTTGASAGGTKTYTFIASRPGTFLYEAGLITGKQHQVAMGLYGALIVRPASAPLQAYTSSATAFDTEQVLVLSELDTSLNNSVNPAAFDMRKYSPKYYLINGRAYPDTDLPANQIPVTAGNKVLLRYVDAGLQAHAMSTLGLSQSIIAQDGSAFTNSHSVISETIAPGQTLDTIVTIPAAAVIGTKYPLYDATLMLRNNNGTSSTSTAGIGGMLTFLTISVGAPPPPPGDTTGPLASALGLSPNPTNGSVNVTVSATISDVTTGGSNIDQAEFYIDSTAGSPTAMTGSFGSQTATVAGTIPSATLGILASGNHTIYVRGHDSAGNWGSFLAITLNLDKAGPLTSGLQLSGFDLSSTGDDTATGGSNVTAAEYWVDAGSHVAMTLVAGTPASIRNFTATIPSAGLQGPHVVSVRSQDSFGNWGAPSTINLNANDTGLPTTSNVSASPNPNNGSTPLNTTIQAVRVTADFSDVATGNSNIVAAEGFLNVAGTNGTGFVFIALDGNFNSPAEPGYADIPLAVVNTLSNGAHPICVHAKDASGNWGVIDCSYNLDIDRTPPAVISITRIGANPTNATNVQFLVTFSEAVANVSASNFTLVENLSGSTTITSVTGTGTTRTVTATTGTGAGTIGLNLTSPTGITDVAGNAMTNTGLPLVGEVYTISPAMSGNLYFSTSGTTGSGPSGVGADDADIYFYNGSGFSLAIDASGAGSLGLPAGANVDGFDRVSATQFYMSFDGNVTLPGGAGTVQNEDVVYYNAGTWSVYFDGTPASSGLSGSNIDAISIVGGTLYFSTSDSTQPTGVSGGGDDADIYAWNGSAFTRVFDATFLGWSSNNVDGLVYVDATHFYLSYSSTTTTVSGLGSVDDEDVVYYNNGIWSVYFDGTSLGLGANGSLDIDAFDIP